MYIPTAFAVEDSEQLNAFIRDHSFAILVSAGENPDMSPMATHLPLLLMKDSNNLCRLVGHMAKGNPHWKIANTCKVLAIFAGPHAMISASWYGEKNVVPTWNYVTVHVTGTLRIEQDPDRLIELLSDTVGQLEVSEHQAWSLDATDSDFRARMLNGIVGFSIEIERIEGCWKLNQHHSESRRNGAIEGLRQRAHGDDLKIAELMAADVFRSS